MIEYTKRVMIAFAGLAIAMAGCGEAQEEVSTKQVTLSFAMTADGERVSCGSSAVLGSDQKTFEFNDLKFFVHDIEMIRADGTRELLALDQDEMWQHNNIALLDFEDATNGCSNGTSETREVAVGQAPEGEYVGVSFRVGVPFEMNHADAASAPSPLNLPSMFWSWQGGYKFVRIDGRAEGAPSFFHLGSSGCEGEADDVTGCMAPNRPEIVLSGDQSIEGATIELSLSELYSGVTLAPDDEMKSAICMSAPGTPSCDPIFEALGLGSSSQSAFSIRHDMK